MIPATEPCSDFGKQLMPFELSVGYRTDINSPHSGSRKTPTAGPPIRLPAKQMKIARLSRASTVDQDVRPHIHAPTIRPAARSTKNTGRAYGTSQAAEPW